MDEFRLDPGLHDTLKGIRESVRKLFEELRLKHEAGDVAGKERLERVPALAKRNFANLSRGSPLLAAKEAWRLIDFLEGGSEARLSPRAREALRVIELDKRLAALRASSSWKESAAGLRKTLGVGPGALEAADPAALLIAEEGAVGRPDRNGTSLAQAVAPTRVVNPARRLGGPLPLGLVSIVVIAGAACAWRLRDRVDPRYACIRLEDASASALAAHRATSSAPAPVARPPSVEGRQRVYVISDPPNGGAVQSLWTTSRYSYAERDAAPEPGGGRSDARLRIGGWGDTYLSLLQVPVPTDRLAHAAVIQMRVIGDEAGSRPTSMTLRAVTDHWSVRGGPNERLWWRDCPRSDAIATHLPPPGPRGSLYEIDITDLYNSWAGGFRPAYGIMLEPEHIGSWGPGRPHFPHYSTFYSTRAREVEHRPRLVLTY